MKWLLAAACVLGLSGAAFADGLISLPRYALALPEGVAQVDDTGHEAEVEASLRADITQIVHTAAELRNFPLSPEAVLPQVKFQTPITHLEHDGVDLYAFTVDVPVPLFLRDILLDTFFVTDVGTPSEKGYFLRLHKERAYGDADVGIILARGPSKEALLSPEVEQIIASFEPHRAR